MKRITFIIILLMIVLLVGCDLSDNPTNNSNLEYGSLTVYTDGIANAKSILPQQSDILVHHYNISGHLTTDDNINFNDNFTGTSFTKEKLIAGTWSFEIKGYNSSNQVISKSGTTEVSITQNKNASKTVDVAYLTTGEGTFSITMRIPSDQNVANVHVVLVPVSSHLESSNIVYNIPLDTLKIDGTKYIYEDSRSIVTGDYDATITMLDADSDKVGLPIIESLHIHKNLTSSFVWAWDDAYFDSVPNPVFATEPGTYDGGQTVTITTSDPDSTVYYTTDNSDPRTSESRIEYNSPIALSKNTLIKACCVKGKLISEVINGVFNIRVATPVLSVNAGTYTDTQRITITCATTNARIYYTTDGTVPSSSKTLYEEEDEIVVSKNTTLKVIAIKTNLTDSNIVEAAYTIDSQNLGITINAPSTVHDFEMVVPVGWNIGTAVVNGVSATLYPNVTLKGIYYWYIDGEEIRYKNGNKPNYDLLLGTGDGNFELTPGAHIITLKVKLDNTTYSCSYPLIVSGNGIGTATVNTTHGEADYVVGDTGPSGGYVCLVLNSYNTSGYRYVELESPISASVKKYPYSDGYCVDVNATRDLVDAYTKNGYDDWELASQAMINNAPNAFRSKYEYYLNHPYVTSDHNSFDVSDYGWATMFLARYF